MSTEDRPIIGITMGDPAGVGSEVIVRAYPDLLKHARIVVVGDHAVMERAIDVCESSLGLQVIDSVDEAAWATDQIPVLSLDNVADLEFGVVREAYGAASLAYVERAIDLAIDGVIDAITTAPINKQATRLAGSTYAGHTGMLADFTDTENYSMMLIEGDFRVTHVSTHVSVREACDLVTTERVLDTIRVTDDALRELGVAKPRIAVSGLNPHASDGGLLGSEEEREITPAVEQAQAEGIEAIGPESPDTVYVQAAAGDYDCTVAMYHDQGHIPTKMLGFQDEGTVSGVNMTIGLPIVRTSVDHGTAFDIAGDGVASATSLVDAVRVASQVARTRSAQPSA